MELTERGRNIITTFTDQGKSVVNSSFIENGQVILYGLTPDSPPVLSGSFSVDHIALTWV